jgi:dihydrofolate reductase
MKIIAIAAVSKNGIIGSNNQLPWDIPEDLKYFKDCTRGQIVVMGRKTYESLGKPLPKRENAVITSNADFLLPDGVLRFADLQQSIHFYRQRALQNPSEAHGDLINCFIIGGGQIYTQSLTFLDEVWLTEIDQIIDGDVFFPEFSQGKFKLAQNSDSVFYEREVLLKTDLQCPVNYRFVRYARRSSILS